MELKTQYVVRVPKIGSASNWVPCRCPPPIGRDPPTLWEGEERALGSPWGPRCFCRSHAIQWKFRKDPKAFVMPFPPPHPFFSSLPC